MSGKQSETIQAWVQAACQRAGDASPKIEVHSDDDVHFQIRVISPVFQGLSRVRRQQLVYDALSQAITTGGLHAVELKTYTPDEWMGGNNKNDR